MSKITAPAITTREALPDAPDDEWIDTLLENTNSFHDQVRAVLQNGFSVVDNTPWKTVSLNMVHGVQYEIKNPFDDPAMAVKRISIDNAIGLTLGTDGKPDGGTYTIMQPQIGWRPSGKPSGSVYVTVQYAPPLGRVSLSRSTVQSVAQLTITGIQWTTRILPDQGALSCDVATGSGSPPVNTRIVCSAAGEVRVSCSAVYDRQSGSNLFMAILKNGNSNTRYGYSFWGPAPVLTAFWGAAPSALIQVAAGDYLQMVCYHDSGPATRDIIAGADVPTLQAQYVAPDPSTTARVTLLFQGA